MGERTPPCGACWPPPVAGLSSARQGGSHRLAAPQAVSLVLQLCQRTGGGLAVRAQRPEMAPSAERARCLPGSRCQAASMVAGMEPNAENKLFVGGCPAGSGEEDLRTVRCPPPAPAHHIIL